jgi:hypothetical protein
MRIWKEKHMIIHLLVGRPESMDMDVFDIELNKNTYDEYLKS